MRTSVFMNMSSVWVTTPWDEFSTGTTPKSTSPPWTRRNTSSIPVSALALTECPNCLNTACWVKVPSGPR